MFANSKKYLFYIQRKYCNDLTLVIQENKIYLKEISFADHSVKVLLLDSWTPLNEYLSTTNAGFPAATTKLDKELIFWVKDRQYLQYNTNVCMSTV